MQLDNTNDLTLSGGQNSFRINDNVKLISCDEGLLFQKRMEVGFDIDFCQEKMKYINWLRELGLNTPRVYSVFESEGRVYELQEYFAGYLNARSVDDDQIRFISCYHKISSQYNGTYNNKPVRRADATIRGRKIDRILIGFREKYYTYPMKELMKAKKPDDRISIKLRALFDEFTSNYCISDCIVHNDLTTNNIMQSALGEYAIVDFDFATQSSVYVDIVDTIMTRDYGFMDYGKIFGENRTAINHYIKKYNSYNNGFRIDFRGFALMSALKLFAFAIYLYAPIHELSADEVEMLCWIADCAMASI